MRLALSLLIVIVLVAYIGTHVAKQLRLIGKAEVKRIDKAYTEKTNGKEEKE